MTPELRARWALRARQGTKGDTGATGATGPTGAQGPGGLGLLSLDNLNGTPCNNGQGTTKLTYSTSGTVTIQCLIPGLVLGTFNVGLQPFGIAFDHTNMWVANFNSDNVTELSPAGAMLGAFSVGGSPIGIVFDGTNMWVTDTLSGIVTELSPTGAVLGTFVRL